MKKIIKTNYYWLDFETIMSKLLVKLKWKHLISVWLLIVYIQNTTYYGKEWCERADVCDTVDLAHRIIPKLIRMKIIKRRKHRRLEIIR